MNAVHKNGISRIARIAQCRDRTKGSLGRYTAKPKDKIEGMITPRHFAPGLSNDTNRNNRAVFPARNCDLRARVSIADFSGAPAAKTDIDWF